jgi:hypothetical protein
MYIVVLILGLVAFAAGLAAFGYGLLIKEFSFGGTLLIAGTTTFVGGLVMIAIAGAIRELHRIAQAMINRPVPMPRFPRPGEALDPYEPGAFRPGMNASRMPPAPPVPMPPPPVASAERPVREPPRSPGLDASAPPAAPEPAGPATSAAGLNEPETVPLLPQEPSLPLFDAPGDGHGPSQAEPQASAHEDGATAATDRPPSDTQPDAPQSSPSSSPFDAIWPPRGPAAERWRGDDDAAVHTEGEALRDEAMASPATSPGDEPEASSQRDGTAAEPATAENAAAAEPNVEAPYAVSILKSGVVDGMAYTLYSDGSIEAELAAGTIRFASINELRTHLEKAG